MICDMNSIYKRRTKEVRFYDTDSGAEFNRYADLIGLEKEDVSIKLGEQIVRLSPYLQEVQKAIRDSIFYQKNAKDFAQMEEESFTKKGFKKKSPGVWQLKGGDGKMYDVKELSDYPVNLEEEKKERK